MQHDANWRVEKSIDQHDLVVCLTGTGDYLLNGKRVTLGPGEGLLIPGGSHFRGWRSTADLYTGIAQHFRLDLFNEVDLLSQMELHTTARFRRWEMMQPVVSYYREIAPSTSTNLIQQHMFMFILLEFLDAAFIRWREQALINTAGSDALSLHIMLMAADISRDPMNDAVVEESLARRPYNPDYLRRAFRDRFVHTPRKFRELKRMEYAMSLMSRGHSVKQAAIKVGYSDPLYFSRQFKKFIGSAPSAFRFTRKALAKGAPNSDHPAHTRGVYTGQATSTDGDGVLTD